MLYILRYASQYCTAVNSTVLQYTKSDNSIFVLKKVAMLKKTLAIDQHRGIWNLMEKASLVLGQVSTIQQGQLYGESQVPMDNMPFIS